MLKVSRILADRINDSSRTEQRSVEETRFKRSADYSTYTPGDSHDRLSAVFGRCSFPLLPMRPSVDVGDDRRSIVKNPAKSHPAFAIREWSSAGRGEEEPRSCGRARDQAAIASPIVQIVSSKEPTARKSTAPASSYVPSLLTWSRGTVSCPQPARSALRERHKEEGDRIGWYRSPWSGWVTRSSTRLTENRRGFSLYEHLLLALCHLFASF